jgi:hypothetical protein
MQPGWARTLVHPLSSFHVIVSQAYAPQPALQHTSFLLFFEIWQGFILI